MNMNRWCNYVIVNFFYNLCTTACLMYNDEHSHIDTEHRNLHVLQGVSKRVLYCSIVTENGNSLRTLTF